ncbi:MAG TPA: amidohydrolase family protein, partial [Pyrinomonadaceae bacterium]|nr:amidohydrolase family protein [Pyrinomonadaceae bacterium]
MAFRFAVSQIRQLSQALIIALSFCLLVSLLTPAQTSSSVRLSPKPKLVAILGATLIDGSGRSPVKDSIVIIRGDSIEAVGKRGQIKVPAAAEIIDARTLVLAPGFIDAHSHAERGLRLNPAAETQVSQGITTIAAGQDGGSAFPVGESLKRLDQAPAALNVFTFVGHATVRSKVMGEDTDRTATQTEIEQMKSLVDQGMHDGAFGLSSGLEYETGKPA